MLGLVEDGDLLVIYGASSNETEKSNRNQVLGFLQVAKRAIRDIDKASAAEMQRKLDSGWRGKWTFAIPVVRAWRATESILLERIAPKTYRPEAGQAIAVWSPPLFPEEVDLALRIRVREVNVFGEPALADPQQVGVPFATAFKPSRAFRGSFGLRASLYEDGPTYLYLARFDGDGDALLSQKSRCSARLCC